MGFVPHLVLDDKVLEGRGSQLIYLYIPLL